MEFYGKLNLLKTGLVFADTINTVSPRYAKEIQVPPMGAGLEGVLQHHAEVLYGILNGIDEREWNPATDAHLPLRYTPENVCEGKRAAKAKLQQELRLPLTPDVPLLGFIGRLVDQKGVDLLTEVMQQWLQSSDAQWVVLGTGEPKYHRLLESLRERFPQRVAARLEFSDRLAHLIEGGADIFVMPSRFEPCGLNQLYSLKYGTVPVVRATGGLADTIVDAAPAALEAGTANGFSFQEYNPLDLAETLRRAVDAYRRPDAWRRLQATGMRQDWSWAASARNYVELYEETVRRGR
jgi:starch synthase